VSERGREFVERGYERGREFVERGYERGEKG